MKFHKNKLLTAVAAAALTFGVAACSSNGDDDEMTMTTTPPATGGDTGGDTGAPAPELTELQAAQAAAAAAAAAMTASTGAAEAVAAAVTAVANLATTQTGEMAGAQAAKAHEYAAAAMAAYMDAKMASDAAAAATTTSDAVEARVAAVAAQKAAETAAMKAGEYIELAVASAAGELMIDGTVKSVGDTTVNAAAAASTVASGTGANRKTAVTGLIELAGPNTPGAQTLGRMAVAEITGTDATEYKSPVANAAMRPLTIGKTVDSDDDAARLRIVTKFASTQSVKVFARNATPDDPALSAKKPGVITLIPTDENDPVDRPLTSLGSYYQAGDDVILNTADTGEGATEPVGDTIDTATKPVNVYSYEDADGETAYAVLHGFETVGDETTYSYATADIFVPHDPDGDTNTMDMTQVSALLPVARDYSHIHFGVWASLGDASSTGSQNLDDLGIGFVQSIGDGLTADMPNNGTGTYAGNWVASVQGSHPTGEGNIREMSGPASLTANFRKGEVDGMLSTLASFKADIEDASFATDAVKVTAGELDADDKWTGGLSGAFYGDEAIEAGGVFNFATKDNKGGAFTGAFGTARTDK